MGTRIWFCLARHSRLENNGSDMQIPNVRFDHSKTNRAECELLELEQLFQRFQSGEHDPQIPHRINFFNLIVIEAGKGEHMVDFQNVPFQPGSVLFIQREQVHAFDLTNRPQGKVLLFTQAFLDQVHANMRLPNFTPTHLNRQHVPVIQLDAGHKRRCGRLLQELTEEMTSPNTDPLIVMYLFCSLSLLLNRLRPEQYQQQLSDDQSLLLACFFDRLQANFDRVRDANWYASQVNTTYKTLNKICKLATQLTAKQLIDAYTIIEIKRRLVLSRVTSQQIAYELGFEDVSNFNKYFRNQTSVTPGQFRKHHTRS